MTAKRDWKSWLKTDAAAAAQRQIEINTRSHQPVPAFISGCLCGHFDICNHTPPEIVREFPGWQPIETAPKDGTNVLTSDGRHEFSVAVAAFRTFHPNAEGPKCWRTYHGHKLQPAYWMPVPPLPGR